jgi:hypothetical protein
LHDESDDALRFRIHFKNVVGLIEPEPSSFQIWSNDSKVYINIPNSINEKALIQFFDLQGKVVYKGEHYLNNPEIIDVHSNQRILIARIITGNHVYTQKVFIR